MRQVPEPISICQNSLVANVIRSYIDVLTQQQLLNIEQSRLTVLENNEAVVASAAGLEA